MQSKHKNTESPLLCSILTISCQLSFLLFDHFNDLGRVSLPGTVQCRVSEHVLKHPADTTVEQEVNGAFGSSINRLGRKFNSLQSFTNEKKKWPISNTHYSHIT